MAIDTKAKRMSMLYIASPIMWGAHFEVDGAVDADDRAHLLHIYGGNALADPAPVVAVILEFGAGDDEDEDRLIMAIIKAFVRRVS